MDVQSNTVLMSEGEAAARLGISKITLLRLRHRGAVGFYRIGSRIRYSPEHIQDFLNKQERNRQGD